MALQLSLVRPWQSAGRPENDRMVIFAMHRPMHVKSPGRERTAEIRHDRRPSVLQMWTPQMMNVVYIRETRPYVQFAVSMHA